MKTLTINQTKAELTNIVTELDILTTEATEATERKSAKADLLFHTALNNVLNSYLAEKETVTVKYRDYVQSLISELTEATEKESIIKLLNVLEYNLLNQSIKHEMLSVSNAKKLFNRAEQNRALTKVELVSAEKESIRVATEATEKGKTKAEATEKAEKAYNKAINTIVINNELKEATELKEKNAELYNALKHTDSETIALLNKLIRAEQKESEKAEKELNKKAEADIKSKIRAEIKSEVEARYLRVVA